MWFHLKNSNISAYPHVSDTFPVNSLVVIGGTEANAIEINSIDELLSLDALCKADNEYYTGIRINGNTITFVEKEYFSGEQIAY